MDKEKCTEDWLYQLGQILYRTGTGASDCYCGQKCIHQSMGGAVVSYNLPAFSGQNLPYPLFIQGMAVDAVFSYNCRNLLFVFGTG